MGTDPAGRSRSGGRRRRVSDLEEREFVAGHEDSRHVSQHRQRHGGGGDDDARPEITRRGREGVAVGGGALPSPPTPSRERDSDGTNSDVDADTGADSLAQEPLFFPCPVCLREFRSELAVYGHMRVHDPPRGRQQVNKERTPAINFGWAVTGKRGSVGGRRPVSPQSEGTVESPAIVVVSEPVIDPTPIAPAGRSSGAEPIPPNDDSIAILSASSDNPTNKVVAHPPCSPQFLQGYQPAASQVVVAQAQPTVAQGQELAMAAAPQFVVNPPAAPQVVAHHVQRTSPPRPSRDGQRFATHQGLGGHRNRQNNEAAAAGLHLGVGDAARAKPAKLHPCKHCPRVFNSGYQLGGHMRTHSEKVIGGKKCGARPEVPARDLASSAVLALPVQPAAMEVAPAQPALAPGAAMEVAPAQPAVAPGEPGVVRLFGVNIVPAAPPASAAEEVPSAVTEMDQSSPASTNIEQ